MKKLLTILLLITTTGLTAQTLMLSETKGRIVFEMRRYSTFHRVQSDTLRYQRGTTTIDYLFTGKRCTAASISMPANEAEAFITEKTSCNCWKPVAPDEWIYETNVFDNPVTVVRSEKANSVKFTYRFNDL